MKKLVAIPLLLLLATSLIAAPAPKTDRCCEELQFSGNYTKAKDGPNTYAFDGQLTFPLSSGGRFLLGPKLRYSSVEAARAAGLVADLNILGPNSSGPYGSLAALYDIHAEPDAKRYTVDAAVGWKQRIVLDNPKTLSGAFVNAFVTKTVAGRKCDQDYAFNVGIGARF